MAKRKRLSLDSAPSVSEAPPREMAVLFPVGRPPISQVTGEAAASAALRDVSAELTAAREEGRLVQRLPLAAVEVDYLLRDRILTKDDDLQSLLESLRLYGQRTPIEVTELGDGRYGLISGWRRLTALHQLHAETGEDRFAHVLALLRRPDTAAEAYVAMVEENEIRVGLSYWERARIVARAVESGVFPTDRIALQRLFATASRARRSKIGSFLTLYRALDGVLRFPTALSERTGLALAQALAEDPTLAERLARGAGENRPETPDAELALIRNLQAKGGVCQRKVSSRSLSEKVQKQRHDTSEELTSGIFLRVDLVAKRLELSGPGVTAALVNQLRLWASGQER